MKHTKESLMEMAYGYDGPEEGLETALTEVFAERDALLAACKLFLAYDACDSASDMGVKMMLAYNAACEASKAAVAKAEGEMK
jgi:hypothetical protein